MLIQLTDEVQDSTIRNFVTPLPIYVQLNLNTNTDRVNSLTSIIRLLGYNSLC